MVGEGLLTERGDMMATKLEWKEHGQGNWEAKGRDGASIFVRGNGTFDAWIDGHGLEGAATFAEAVKYCQEVENAAAPAELPKPGDVWGVPGKRGTRRFVVMADLHHVRAHDTQGTYLMPLPAWDAWLTSTGAVRIDGDAARVAALEAEAARLRANQCPHDYGMLKLQIAVLEGVNDLFEQERDDARTRVAALEAEAEKREKRMEAFHERALAAEMVRDDLRTKLAALEQQYQACEDKVATEFERCGRMLEALRGIEGMPPTAYPSGVHPWALRLVDDMRRKAREAIKREEGVES